TKKAPAKKAGTKATTKQASTRKATTKKSVTSTASRAPSAPSMLVAQNEKPWSQKELADLRAEIESDIAQLEEEIARAEAALHELLQDAGDGAGDDQADAGAKTFEREQEISLANNARDLLDQNRRALERMDDGSYGVCENCGNPIGKLRLQAAPRATLCMPCKTKEERR
ncbi:MAG: TraR/DksA C4-type zinc finger protein, partial [Actinomycetia bacterium]|nr:TraR/DksA C4-type zinc finger protein [Actinomycetes bacterium]